MVRKLTQLIKKTDLQKKDRNKKQMFLRANLKGKVFIHDENRLYITQLVNLSAGGMFVAELLTIPKGKLVRVVIKSPELEMPIQLEGTVVRIEKEKRRGLAVEFKNLDRNTRSLIQSCIVQKRVEGALNAA